MSTLEQCLETRSGVKLSNTVSAHRWRPARPSSDALARDVDYSVDFSLASRVVFSKLDGVFPKNLLVVSWLVADSSQKVKRTPPLSRWTPVMHGTRSRSRWMRRRRLEGV